MTDIEKLVKCLKPLRHPATCQYWEHHKTLEDCNCGLTEVRELAARVKEELEEAQQLEMNIQRQVKIINGLEMANATLRAKNEVLSDWRDSWRRV